MERLLLGTAHMLAWARKRRTAAGGFEEFLGEFLDTVYHRAGVLVDAPAAGEGAAAGRGASAGGGPQQGGGPAAQGGSDAAFVGGGGSKAPGAAQ
jgi:hypothetical protein